MIKLSDLIELYRGRSFSNNRIFEWAVSYYPLDDCKQSCAFFDTLLDAQLFAQDSRVEELIEDWLIHEPESVTDEETCKVVRETLREGD